MVTRRPWTDAALATGALGIGLVHLTYPLGREHALLIYAGREWLTHGRAPYSEVYVTEGPGLVLVAGLVALVGSPALAWRALHLFVTLGVGLLAAKVVAGARGRRGSAPMYGVGALSAALFAFGGFGFWDSARGGELFALFIALALVSAKSGRVGGGLLAGAASAFAFLIRPVGFPVALLSVIVALLAGRSARRVGMVIVGVAAVLVAFRVGLGPGATADAYDLLWDGRCSYLGPTRHQVGANVLSLLDVIAAFQPVSGLAVFGFILGVAQRLARRDGRVLASRALVVLVGVTTFVSVALLGRYFFDVASGTLFVALLSACVAEDWKRAGQSRAQLAVGGALALLATVRSFVFSPEADSYWIRATNAWSYATGTLDRNALAGTFDLPDLAFSAAEMDLVSAAIRGASTPNDPVLVRGFEPQIYLMAERRIDVRFVVTPPLVWPGCAYRRAEWSAQDRLHVGAAAPRVVVALAGTGSIDSADAFLSAGYVIVADTPHFRVLRSP